MAPKTHGGGDLPKKRTQVLSQIRKDESKSRVKGGTGGGSSNPAVMPKKSRPVSKRDSSNYYAPDDGRASPYTE